MYAGNHDPPHPGRAAFIMAGTGEAVSHAEHERRTNRLAHLLRAEGLERLDHYAIFEFRPGVDGCPSYPTSSRT